MSILDSVVSNFGLPVAALAALVTYYFDRRRAADERRAMDRREHYRNVILCLKSLREGRSDNIDLLQFEYAFLFLYAPDGVLQAAGALLDKISAGHQRVDELAPLINELIIQMRRDMGFSRVGLGVAPRNFF